MTRPVRLTGARVVEADGVERRDLVLAGGRVAAATTPDAPGIDAAGLLAFPGLVNAHDHLTLNVFDPPPIPPQRSFYDWADLLRAYRASPEGVARLSVHEETRAWHGAFKNLAAGVTVVAHHDPWSPAFDDPEFPVAVLRDFGWAHSLRFAGRWGAPVDAAYAATPRDRPFFLHLAEGTDEEARGELPRLDAMGALGSNTVIVHGVGLRNEDVARVLDAGAGVVWCPASNRRTLGATLERTSLERLAAAGRVALGTDARLTGSRDLLEEMRVARAEGRLTPREVFALVTTRAASLLRLPDAGHLRPGARADVLLLSDTGADPYERLLGARPEDVVAVLRGGRLVRGGDAVPGLPEAA